MAENQWRWIGTDGFEYTGNLEKLQAAVRDGGVSPTCMVSSTLMEGWLPASEVPELGAHDAPLPAFKVEDEAPTMRDNPLPEPPLIEPEPPTARRGAAKGSSAPWVMAVVVLGLAVLGAIGGVSLWLARRPQAMPRASASAAASAAVAPPPPLSRTCAAGRARLISKPAYGKVPLEVAAVGQGRVAVGFARTRAEAEVVVLAAESLDEHSKKRQPSKATVTGAQPLLRGDGVELVLDTEESNLADARTILGDDPLRIGAAPRGIARRAGDSEPDVIWPLNERELTPVRVESHPTAGHFVALRAGGQSGKVLAGWLGRNGEKSTDLVAPELPKVAVGTPTPVVSRGSALILVAAKASDSDDYQLFAGKSPVGKVPERFAPVALGPGGARISPAAVALGDRGWLLQWTERTPAGHVVKLRVLDEALAPVGEAIAVSPQGADAGQGRVWLEGDRAVSFFLVSTGEQHELWAAPLSCK
ncbi:MAG: DUF4339 domain-containing protein [Myxococcales bacterium]|nr:DUF4339 domain-containing protein [Myxococcales bacterium]